MSVISDSPNVKRFSLLVSSSFFATNERDVVGMMRCHDCFVSSTFVHHLLSIVIIRRRFRGGGGEEKKSSRVESSRIEVTTCIPMYSTCTACV